jgi:hypothetical protein
LVGNLQIRRDHWHTFGLRIKADTMERSTSYWNGGVEVIVEPREMRMSHWVYAPKLVDASAGSVLLDLTGKLWDLVSVTDSGDSLILRLRKYPGDRPEVVIQILRDGRKIVVEGNVVDSEKLEIHLEAAIR